MNQDNYGSDDDPMGYEDNIQEGYSEDSPSNISYSDENPDAEGNEDLDEEEDDEESHSEESNLNYEVMEEANVPEQPNKDRITSPFMTKFEKAKIIGIRAVQISKNAPLYLNSENVANMNYDPITIAQKELAEKKIPFIIRRYLPDSTFEDWKLSQLKTFD